MSKVRQLSRSHENHEPCDEQQNHEPRARRGPDNRALALALSACSADASDPAWDAESVPAGDVNLGPSTAEAGERVVSFENDVRDTILGSDAAGAEPGVHLHDYSLNASIWRQSVVKWIVDPPDSRLRSATINAVNAWDSVTKNLDFSEAATAGEAHMVIRRDDGLGDLGGTANRSGYWQGSEHVLVSVAIAVNVAISGTNDNFLAAMVMHEVGHGIGLGHSTLSSGPNMAASFTIVGDTPKFNFIIEEDIRGAQSLYGMVHSSTYRYVPYPWVVTGASPTRTNTYNQWGFVDADISKFRSGSQLLSVVCPKGTVGCK